MPPRSFFPEEKDLPTGAGNLRANLITVPSCDKHNNRFSKDDEIAAYTLLLHHNSNPSAAQQFKTKAMRAFLRRPDLSRRVITKAKPVLRREPGSDLFMPTLACKIDISLIERVMERIARGLYFHHFSTLWRTELLLASHGLLMHDSLSQGGPFVEGTSQLELHMHEQPANGENPSIFNYKWLPLKASYILRMCFYDGLIYYALPRSATEARTR